MPSYKPYSYNQIDAQDLVYILPVPLLMRLLALCYNANDEYCTNEANDLISALMPCMHIKSL